MLNKKIVLTVAASVFAFTSAFAITAFAEQGEMHAEMKGEMGHSMIQPLESMLKKLEQLDTKEFNFTAKQLEATPKTMTINPQGQIRITNGKVTAISSDTITVQIWMMNFTVHNMSARVVAGEKQDFAFNQIAVGDMVEVLGQLDTVTPAYVHASLIRDRTAHIRPNTEEQSRLQALITELIKRLNAILISRGQNPLPTPSFSPTPSATPSPSASASPSPSPSASASPSPSPSTT